MNKSILIGIAGGTGSGKTHIAKSIKREIQNSTIVVIEQDSYYKDLSHFNLEYRNKINFDHPDSIDYKLLIEDLNKLLNGETINVPIYDYTTHTRSNKFHTISKCDIIILEGILALFAEDIRKMMAIKIFIDTADDIRIIRRIKRDTIQRNRTLDSIIKQYYKSVRPMHLQFVEPTKKFANLIVSGNEENASSINIIIEKINSVYKIN